MRKRGMNFYKKKTNKVKNSTHKRLGRGSGRRKENGQWRPIHWPRLQGKGLYNWASGGPKKSSTERKGVHRAVIEGREITMTYFSLIGGRVKGRMRKKDRKQPARESGRT